MNSRFGVPAIAVAAAALVAGCGSDSSGDEQADKVQRTELVATTPEARGDVEAVTWGLPYGEPATIDPLLGLAYSPSFVSSQMCESLLMRDDETGGFKPHLASFEQPDDKTLVLTPRQDVTFWDGKPMTADDVLYTLQRAAAPDSYVNYVFSSVSSMEKTGDNEVTIKFSTPDPLMLHALTTFPGQVVQKDFAEKAGTKFGAPSVGVMCTGPFAFDRWNSGSGIELVRNEDYWNDEWRARSGRISFTFFNDSTALAQALLADEVDGAYEVPYAAIPRLRTAANGKLHYGPSRQYANVSVSRLDGPLGDAKLRRALNGVWDREGVSRVVFAGAAEPLFSVIEPDSWDPAAKDAWAAFDEQNTKAKPLSVDEARKLVEESGYRGEPITIVTLAGDQTQSALMQVLQDSAKQIGVVLEAETLQPTEYSEAQTAKNSPGDASFQVNWNGTPNPLEMYGFIVLPNAYNTVGYGDPEVTKLYAEARSTADPARRNALAVEIAETYEATNLTMPLAEPHEVLFLNDRLTGALTAFDYIQTPSLAKVGAAEAG